MLTTSHMYQRSVTNLIGVDDRLVVIWGAMIEFSLPRFYPCVIEGFRSETRQALLVKAGASQKLDSAHLHGRAIDFAMFPGHDDPVGETMWGFKDWSPEPYIELMAKVLPQFPGTVWGGNWRGLRDYGHIEVKP